MKRLPTYLLITLLTFFIGLLVTAVWLLNRDVPEIETPKTEITCNFPTYEPKEYSLEKTDVLGRFKEVSLENLPDCIDESYRLVLIPTFHSPVAIRIWRSDGKYFLVVKKLNGKGGYGMGELSDESIRSLTEDEWLDFKSLLSQPPFWEMPTIDKNEAEPNDGATWMIEGGIRKKRHKVLRRTPFKSCVYLLKLAHLETEYEGYWK